MALQAVQTREPSLEKQVALLTSQTSQWITSIITDPKQALSVPKGYNVGNEIASAIYAISQIRDRNGRSVIEACSAGQIMNEIKDMVAQGLSVAKKQVYPIIYDGKLTLQRGYNGTIAALSYMYPGYQVGANVLYEGDEYDYCTDDIAGYNYITNIRSKLENRDKPIIAAYGSIYDKATGKRVYGCVMTIDEIRRNWAKSKDRTGTVHKEFPQEMAKRTLINRMCKIFVNTGANTNTEMVGAFNRMTEAEYINVTPEKDEESTDAQRMLHSRSKGKEGLEALLDAAPEKAVEEGASEPVVAEEEASPANEEANAAESIEAEKEENGREQDELFEIPF